MISASSATFGVDQLAEREQHLGRAAQRRLRPVGERLPGRCTAASTSAGRPAATSACCSPVAGFHTGARRVAAPARRLAADPVLDGPHRAALRPFPADGLVGARAAGGGAVRALCASYAVRASCVRVQLRDLGHGHVPPGGAVRRRDQRVGLDVDDGRPPACAAPGAAPSRARRCRWRGARRRRGSRRWRPGRPGARRRRAPVSVAVAVAGAEPLRAERLRQRADRGEAVVLHQHDDAA